MSDKYEMVKRYYNIGIWTLPMTKMAVKKNWITAEEFEMITGKRYEEQGI